MMSQRPGRQVVFMMGASLVLADYCAG
jgi:hypothetical protein